MTLNAEQIDVLTELINMGVGKAACSLSEMVESHVGLAVPKVQLDRWRQADSGGADEGTMSRVAQSFAGGIHGTAELVFTRRSAGALVALLTNAPDDSVDIDAEREAVLTEVGNIIINGVLGSLGNLTSLDVQFGLPRYTEGSLAPMHGDDVERSVVVVHVVFSIEDRAVEGRLAILFDLPRLSTVWTLLDPTIPCEGRAAS